MWTLLLAMLSAEPTVIPLYPDKVPDAVGTTDADKPTLTVVWPAKDKATGTAVVLCPGGGYGTVVMSYEGVEVARWLAERGIAGYVLRYRHGPRYRYPVPLKDVKRALRLVRSRAKDDGVDPERIGVWGFSAGGHLASCAATLFDAGNAKSDDPVERLTCRPAFAVLAYPVIDLEGAKAHAGSRKNLLGDKPDPKLVPALSTHTRVTKETPPTYLFHTTGDKVVLPAHSELFRDACVKAGVSVKLRLSDEGGHGIGLGLKMKGTSKDWAEEVIPWLQERKLLKAPAK
jgi:acetyl esterase/lipase